MVEVGFIIEDSKLGMSTWAFAFTCPVCGQRQIYSSSIHLGQMKCPRCGNTFEVEIRYGNNIDQRNPILTSRKLF